MQTPNVASFHFNPRSPCGERRIDLMIFISASKFQSTLPVRGATSPAFRKMAISTKFQSTLPVRGATIWLNHVIRLDMISIHAPRAGSDDSRFSSFSVSSNFNPRSPCGERRRRTILHNKSGHFNPRSPCGERPERLPRARKPYKFQSTLPVRGATYASPPHEPEHHISIHAPRAGSDSFPQVLCILYTNFNPRSPCGERQHHYNVVDLEIIDFNPRSPCGERPLEDIRAQYPRLFQSTLPVRGATDYRRELERINRFQSTLPVRGATDTNYL